MDYYSALLAEIPNDLQEVVIGLHSGVLKIEGSTDSAVNFILEEPVDTTEAEPAGGQVIKMDTLKIWPASQSVKPPLGSVIVTHGIYWTILAVRYKHQVKTWECRCRNLSIVTNPINPDLNRAWILKASFTKGRANEAKANWKGYISDQLPPTDEDSIVARFQPSVEDAMIRFNGEWIKDTYRVFLQDQLAIDVTGADWRAVDMNGGRYRIMSVNQEQRIDVLPILICIRIIEGSEYFGQGSPAPLPLP